ncbi:EAL domain-containing protein [Thiomicrorhabdus sp. ZW0627]|uniref:EAL domain-containing protein n=1 Tax=Thiomicrorhabdus sp. ZW0627 TaxID=3039774 RepID=UPI002436C985|nr:EAL domain-containing protein [Thiomicrorhabdus sp. ZW0627]MDG6773053.1 EAL domain-containing protein [Thiomicrorhabdus sp. ZW0627]
MQDALEDFSNLSVVVFSLDDSNIVYANPRASELLGYSDRELFDTPIKHIVSKSFWDGYLSDLPSENSNNIETSHVVQSEWRTKDGRDLIMESNVNLHRWQDQQVGVCISTKTNLEKVSDSKLRFINELYNLLNGINKLIVHVSSREELCFQLAQTIVENSTIDFVWTGLVNREESRIDIKHKAGCCQEYIDTLDISLLPDSELSKGPPAQAVLQNRVFVNDDTNRNRFMAPWEAKMTECGFRCSVALPLRQGDRVVGVVTFYSKKWRFDSPEEKELLDSMVVDLNYVLNRFNEQSQSELFFESAKRSPNWMMVCDQSGTIEFVNDSVCQITGYSRQELLGMKPSIFKSGKHVESFYKDFWDTILAGETFNGVFTNKKKNNEIFILDATIVPVKHCDGYKYVYVGKDMSREIELTQELSFVTYYDPITKLHNRTFFTKELENIIANAHQQKTSMALMVVDIKNFAMINDTYGFETGNDILTQVASRLSLKVCENDIVARFGSDEFAIALQGLESDEEIYAMVNKLFDCLVQPIKLSNQKGSIQLNCDCGVVTYPDGSKTVNDLIHNVDLALVNAKKSSSQSIQYYEPDMNIRAKVFLQTYHALQQAVADQDFELHYQPYFESRTDIMAGIESLIRWRRNGELIYPGDFIEELENSGLILMVEDYILEHVFQKAVSWRKYFEDGQRIAINLSAVNFEHQNLLERIQVIMERTGVDPHWITLEIVERALIEDTQYAKTVFKQLRELGFKIAIDDFGTGYSSFGYLLELPADYLKIDMSIIRKIKTDDKALAVVESIITMAHNLEMQTIAEGVEDNETFRLLKLIGCNIIQGFFKARPMDAEALEQFIQGR